MSKLLYTFRVARHCIMVGKLVKRVIVVELGKEGKKLVKSWQYMRRQVTGGSCQSAWIGATTSIRDRS